MLNASRLRVIRRRLLQALPVLVLATFVVFGLLKLMPGDIAITLAGENATEKRIHEIRELYGLNRPFLVQYGSWLAPCGAGRFVQVAGHGRAGGPRPSRGPFRTRS